MTISTTAAIRQLSPYRGSDQEPVSFAYEELKRWAGTARTLVITVPAPRTAPEVLLAAIPGPPGFLWDDGVGTAGAGAVHHLQVDGPERIARLQRAAERVWRRLRVASHPACRPPLPRFYGGLAFAVRDPRSRATLDPWRGFGDASFTLPRFLYRDDGHQPCLSLAVRGAELSGPAARATFLDRLQEVLASLAQEEAPEQSTDIAIARLTRPPRERWIAEVEAIRRAIADGHFTKIVAAHCARMALTEPISIPGALARLGSGSPETLRFAFSRSGGTFLGLTPERLVSRSGRHVATEALAGSIAPGSGQAQRLLASSKDRHEHQLVVDEIRRLLMPFCRALRLPQGPQVRVLHHLLHLQTPMVGVLAADHHVLELVGALHPTPAVGGLPTRAAMDWIREHEREPRGWYAAPVGWFDQNGDGAFAVALRSCLLHETRPNHVEALVYAGAGIVGDSDPEREYAETELKMMTLIAPPPPLAGHLPVVAAGGGRPSGRRARGRRRGWPAGRG